MLWNSMFIAFAMYSRIPVPQADWNEKNMRYAIGFFPFIGLLIGVFNGLYFYWYKAFYGRDQLLFSLLPVIFSLLITGGIHLDGFMDTIDARRSYANKEKKLQIMKDPNTGAFAVIYGIAYFLVLWASWASITLESGLLVCIGYVLSRCFSGIAVTCFPCAKDSGLAKSFQDGAKKKICLRMLLLQLGVVILGILFVFGLKGIMVLLLTLVLFFYFYNMSKEEFGGITGDLAGWFLCMLELLIPVALALWENLVTIYI